MSFFQKTNSIKLFLFLIFFGLILSSCSSKESKLYRKLSKEDAHHTQYKGHYKIGKQYKVKNQTYKPVVDTKYNKTGMASWYGSSGGFHGKKTANGESYDKNVLSAAHPSLPMPSLVKVTNLSNNKSLIVRVNDRGPFSKKRIIDVSEQAAKILGFKQQGTAKVRVQYLHKETQEFLKNLALAPTHGAKAKSKIKNPKCSVNCHVKLVNIKHKLAVTP
jgi:rare lipoprotein A